MSKTMPSYDYPALHESMTQRLAAEDLLLAICGRSVGLDTLHGDGVLELTARISR